MKGCIVVPQDDTFSIQQHQTSYSLSVATARGEHLASSRVTRDHLMREMETIAVQEADLNSAFESLDCTRQKCEDQREAIVQRLRTCEDLVLMLERNAADEASIERSWSKEEGKRWKEKKEMVTVILPEVLTRLEDTIERNDTKRRDVWKKMERLRARRLALREEIATQEAAIASELIDTTSGKTTDETLL